MRYVIGVDEAGRAPLAGPVSVGAVIAPERFDILKAFPTVKDSKLLSAKVREEIYKEALAREAAGDIRICVRFSEHTMIDEIGITRAVRIAVQKSVRRLAPSADGLKIMLDGLLHAPSVYEQETIIHGDALVPIISLASVMAKVRRDRLMSKYARKFPQYGFESHKGYPTARHYAALREHGLSDIHRTSYCKGFTHFETASKGVEVPA